MGLFQDKLVGVVTVRDSRCPDDEPTNIRKMVEEGKKFDSVPNDKENSSRMARTSDRL